MEKLNDMQPNQIADDELEQVGGGRNLFDVFTTEFIEYMNKPEDQDTLPGAAKANNFGISTLEMPGTPDANNIGISTLEMRIDPNKKRDAKNNRKVIKL